MSKIDLNKLKGEIDNRKKERNVTTFGMNSSVGGSNVAPRDAFLNGLMESLNTGRETASSALVKNVENTVATKKGESARLPVRTPQSEVTNVSQNNGVRRISENDMSPQFQQDRDEQFYADLERKKTKTLTESINMYNTGVSTPQYQPQQTYPQGTINEGLLVENVKNIVSGYLTNNLGLILEEAIKTTILDMYATERIKEVLLENKDIMKAVVIETIKEIQQKNRQQKA